MFKKRNKLFRNASLPATFSMSLVLFLVGLLTFTLLFAGDMKKQIKESFNVSLLLNDEITEQQHGQLKKYFGKADFVKSYDFISKEKALEEHKQAMGTDPEEVLGWNPLRAAYEIKLTADYAENDSIDKIEKKLMSYKGVQKFSYQKNMIRLVNENIRKISIMLVGLAIILMLISFSLINNTIRLKIYSNRFLINTMKLVGATPWFIRKPYIKKGVVNGIVASLIGTLLLGILFAYFNSEFGLGVDILKIETILIVVGIMILTGIVLTAISTYFAVGRYIRMRTDDMYFV